MHNGKTFDVSGVPLTVAPTDDGRLRISVGPTAVRLTEAEAAAFIEAAIDVGRDVFEANTDGDVPAPLPELAHETPDAPPVEVEVTDATDLPEEPTAPAQDAPAAPAEPEVAPVTQEAQAEAPSAAPLASEA